MRWHVELTETGTPLRVEHVEDDQIALETARSLAAQAHGGHSRASTEEIERVVGQLADEGLSEVLPGVDRTYAISDRVAVVVAGLDDAATDDDCWRCQAIA